MGQTATLKKISQKLNLSISTVSRALKDHPDISRKTKEKVKELANLMEYEPNSYAINLRTNKSNILGLVVPVISNTFYDSFIGAVEVEARANGYSLLILQSGDNPKQETDSLRICRHNRVDGIFISLSIHSEAAATLDKYQDTGIPVIYVDKVPDDTNMDTICLADAQAATLAADLINQKAKRRILALFGNANMSITKRRLKAFTEKIQPGIDVEIKHFDNSEAAEAGSLAWLNSHDGPSTIFCMSDEILVGAMKAIHKKGISVPSDVSVLAISNGFIPTLFNPEVTYIETSGAALGKLAIRRMLDQIKELKKPQQIEAPCRLVNGGSF